MPAGGETADRVERELRRILAEPVFMRSPQVSKFLDYIVLATLRGDDSAIKAYAIAVDVFGRPADFDPQSDPIVRVQARRLRQMLERVYEAGPSPNGVRILLPTGRYVPVFEMDGSEAAPDAGAERSALTPPDGAAAPGAAEPGSVEISEAPKRRSRRLITVSRPILVIGALVLVASLALSAYLIVAQGLRQEAASAQTVLQPPRIAISEFAAVPDSNGRLVTVSGLAVELMTDLALFSDVEPVYRDNDLTTADAEADFVLNGLVRPTNDGALITTSLRRSNSDATIWSVSLTYPLVGLSERIDEISRNLAEWLGNMTGPLHRDNLQWLATHPESDGGHVPYSCRLLYGLSLQTGEADDADRASACVQPLVDKADPDGLAISAGLLAEHGLMRSPPVFDPEPLRLALARAEQARKMASSDSFVWEQYARVLDVLDRPGEAESAFRSALQLNPANLDAQAAYGRMLSLDGISVLGEQMAASAMQHATTPPAWYFAAPAVNALRGGNLSAALSSAEKLVVADQELGTVLAITAARQLDRGQVVDRYLAQLLDVERFRRYGVAAVLKARLRDESLVRIILAGLQEAGASPAILNGSP